MRSLAFVVLTFALLAVPEAAAQACGLDQPRCPGIHPGALFQARGANSVSVHFVFAAAEGLFVGSCAHCVDFAGNLHPTDGWFPNALPNRTVTPTTTDADIVWTDAAWQGGEDVTHDLALLQVRPEMWWAVTPVVPSWGGPNGIHDQPGVDPREVRQTGSGVVVAGTPLAARQGFLLDWAGGARFAYLGDAQPGDSGSPVLDADNLAVGFLTHAAGTSGDNVSPGERGLVHGLHVQHFMAEVEKATGIRLRLVLAGEDPIEVQRGLAAPAKTQIGDPNTPGKEAPGVPPILVALVLAACALVRRRRDVG